MKKNFPTGMVVLGIAVAVGMVGSQLGGLSGQAAGGESAGCGGDAYYDEDLGQLVDSQGNVVDESGEAGASGSDEQVEGLVINTRPIPAGSAVPGNELVRMLAPNAQAASDLAADSAGTAQFVARADIDIDGRYAVVGWGADEEGYEDLSHIQVLENRNGQWWMINELPADRDRATPLRNLAIMHVTPDRKIFLAIDGGAITYNVATSAWDTPRVEDAVSQLRERFDNGIDARLADEEFGANLSLKGEIVKYLSSEDSDWTNELVETVIGQARFEARSAMSNDLVIGTDASAALLVGACDYGDEPAMGDDGVLYCDACQSGMCFNPLNTLNVLEIAPEEREVLRVEFRENVLARIAPRIEAQNLERMRNPLGIPPEFAAGLARGDEKSWGSGSASNKALWNVSQASYSGESAPNGWTTWVTCEGDNAVAKFIYQYPVMTIAFSGTNVTDFGDWKDNLDTDLRTTNGITTHEGFYEYQEKVAPCLNEHVDMLAGWGIPIDYIVGHSLGGAAATVYSQVNNRRATKGVVTFGAPKTRNNGSCTESGTRFAHVNDSIASNVMGVMGSFNHDLTGSTKLYDESYCSSDCWLGCCPWGYSSRKKTGYQSCSADSGGCSWLADCAYYFATVHTNYGPYL